MSKIIVQTRTELEKKRTAARSVMVKSQGEIVARTQRWEPLVFNDALSKVKRDGERGGWD